MEPFGELRQDLRVAQQMALLANVNRDPKKSAYKPKDFLSDYWRENPTAGSVLEKFRVFAAAHNAREALTHES